MKQAVPVLPIALAIFAGFKSAGAVVLLKLASAGSAPEANASSVDVEYVTGEHLCTMGIGHVLSMPNGYRHNFGQHPAVYDWAMPTCIVALVPLLIIALPHLWGLCRVDCPQEIRDRRRLTTAVAAVPTIVASFKLISVFMPRSWKILFLIAGCYEVYAFWCFKNLILNLAGGSDAWNNEKVLHVLSKQDPLPQMWASVPLACCFKPCVDRRAVREGDLRTMDVLVWQYIIIMPLVQALDMFETMHPYHTHLARLETTSLIIAMYSLFSLLDATHVTLEDRRGHSKFWTIKGTFIGSTLLFRCVSACVFNDVRVGKFCYPAGALAAAHAGAITSILAVALAGLSRYAFPAEELETNQILDQHV